MTMTSNPTFTRIAVELQPPAARITLNNPPLNVIDIRMMEELRAALEQIEDASGDQRHRFRRIGARFLQRRGHRRAHARQSSRACSPLFIALFARLSPANKLTIASVRRHCLGGGAELALMCDIVYASPDSVWGFPEIKLACYPPVASVALSAIVGQKLAAELLLTGRTLDRRGSSRSRAWSTDWPMIRRRWLRMCAAGLAVEPGGPSRGEEGVLCVGLNSLR